MPAADGDSADEELEDGSVGSDEDGWEDGLSDTSQLSDITASQRGKLYSLKEISDFLERTKAERSFSCLRCLKTYLCSTMTETQQTGLALRNIHHKVMRDFDERGAQRILLLVQD
ncbi:UNVERIFIED_CONTAM: hypothetical protein FKN15_055408 [Acipenser sinensis]